MYEIRKITWNPPISQEMIDRLTEEEKRKFSAI